jgi:hypothetical protein
MRRLILVAAIAVMALAVSGGNADACHRRGRQCYSPCVNYVPCVYSAPVCDCSVTNSTFDQPSDHGTLQPPEKVELKKIPSEPLPAPKPPPADLK